MIKRSLLRVAIACMLGLCVMLGRALAESDTVRTLAQACAAEATWLERDCRAIMHVLKRRADRAGISVEQHARDYVSAFKTGLPARRWVLELEEACEQPPSWPARLDWEAHREQCVLLFERVRAFVAGDSIDPCPQAMHWGGDMDAHRAQRAGWRPLACGTANTFYAETGGAVSAAEAKGSR